MDPCWANQNPNLNPPIEKASKFSLKSIPKQKETINQTVSKIKTYFKFSFQ